MNFIRSYKSRGHMYPNHAFGETCRDPDQRTQDMRVAQLLVLLQQLYEAPGGLATLPKPELAEIVSSAVRLCGFVNPIEAQDVIAIVLDAIESQDLIQESP
jgi:hypothetical protein